MTTSNADEVCTAGYYDIGINIIIRGVILMQRRLFIWCFETMIHKYKMCFGTDYFKVFFFCILTILVNFF